MTVPSERLIRIIAPASESLVSRSREDHVRLPLNAGVVELLDALESASSPLYEDVRRYVLQLSGDILAFGTERPAWGRLKTQVAQGGPVILTDLPQEPARRVP